MAEVKNESFSSNDSVHTIPVDEPLENQIDPNVEIQNVLIANFKKMVNDMIDTQGPAQVRSVSKMLSILWTACQEMFVELDCKYYDAMLKKLTFACIWSMIVNAALIYRFTGHSLKNKYLDRLFPMGNSAVTNIGFLEIYRFAVMHCGSDCVYFMLPFRSNTKPCLIAGTLIGSTSIVSAICMCFVNCRNSNVQLCSRRGIVGMQLIACGAILWGTMHKYYQRSKYQGGE